LTPFRIGAKYATISTFLLPPRAFTSRPDSTAIRSLSERSFTLYCYMADIFYVLGPLYKIAAYAFIYRAVFLASVQSRSRGRMYKFSP